MAKSIMDGWQEWRQRQTYYSSHRKKSDVKKK